MILTIKSTTTITRDMHIEDILSRNEIMHKVNTDKNTLTITAGTYFVPTPEMRACVKALLRYMPAYSLGVDAD